MIEQIFLVCGLFAIVIITISYIIGNLIEILFMRIKYGIDKKHNNNISTNIKPSISISYNGDNIVDDKRDETEKRRKGLVRLIRKIFFRRKK